jgi:hypothetical protein
VSEKEGIIGPFFRQFFRSFNIDVCIRRPIASTCVEYDTDTPRLVVSIIVVYLVGRFLETHEKS